MIDTLSSSAWAARAATLFLHPAEHGVLCLGVHGRLITGDARAWWLPGHRRAHGL
jgi:hypothetical protein